jgi:hypothetical protein
MALYFVLFVWFNVQRPPGERGRGGEICDFSLELSGSNETVEALKNGKALESTFSNP